MRNFIYITLFSLLTLVLGKHEQYEGHEIYRIQGAASEIASLDEIFDILSVKATSSNPGHLEAVVKITPDEREKWLNDFERRGLVYNMLADDLAEILRDQDEEQENAKIKADRSGNNMTWDAYYNHDEINDYLDQLAADYPNLITVINAGLSYEGRQIKYVRISTTRFEVLRKPVIIIDAAVHAREWVAPPVALYIINQLVVEQSDRRLLEEIDWIIIPVANPDGYEYSRDVDRMWRKTRSREHLGSTLCPGVDGNRNFDHYWGTRTESANPCSLVYEGPSPFSEPETRIIRDAVLGQISRAQLYISLHSYGNMFLYAWGNNATLPTNGLFLHLAGVTMATAIDALAMPNAAPYIVGNAATVLYFSTGTSRDWTRAVGVPLTYTLELPGYEYDFLVPAQYIKQIVTETWAGIAAGGHFVLSYF